MLKIYYFLINFSGEIKGLEELNADCASLSCSMRSLMEGAKIQIKSNKIPITMIKVSITKRNAFHISAFVKRN